MVKKIQQLKKYLAIRKIKKWLNKLSIDDYVIHDDLTVDVNGNVNFEIQYIWFALKKIPFKFGVVTGNFEFAHHHLSSLENCPQKVGGNFDISSNRLTSLEGFPSEVGQDIHIGNNQIKSLKQLPKIINGDLICDHNQLTSFKDGPLKVRSVYIHNNQLTSLEYMPEVVDNFYCHHNQLVTLKGSLKEVKEMFNCKHNQLTEIDVCPIIHMEAKFQYNPLIPLAQQKKLITHDIKGKIFLNHKMEGKVPELKEYYRSTGDGFEELVLPFNNLKTYLLNQQLEDMLPESVSDKPKMKL